jgi:PST family polysaccharide transporter
MPLSAFLVLMSKELIRILLGPQWDRAAEMFSVLGLASGLYILYYTNSWLHVSLGRSDRWLKWGIFSSTLLGTAFAIGMFFGAKGIAWGYTVTIILMTFPAILYAGKPVGLRAGQVLSRVWRSTFAAIGAAVLFHFIKDLQVFQTPLVVTVALSFVIFIGLFLGIFIILNRGIRPLKEMYSFLRIVVSRKT